MTNPKMTDSAGISRRALVRTAAWSVPAVAIATAMPLAAASTAATSVVISPANGDLPFGPFSADIQGRRGTDPATFAAGTTLQIIEFGDHTSVGLASVSGARLLTTTESFGETIRTYEALDVNLIQILLNAFNSRLQVTVYAPGGGVIASGEWLTPLG